MLFSSCHDLGRALKLGERCLETNEIIMAGKMKILVVEHEVPAAMMIVSLLTHAAYDVQVACSGKKGMELAKELKFDLFILEVNLPDLSGFDIAIELKQRHLSCRTPIIFIASQPCEEDRRHSQELGAADYITKPLAAQDLVRRLLSRIKPDEAVS